MLIEPAGAADVVAVAGAAVVVATGGGGATITGAVEAVAVSTVWAISGVADRAMAAAIAVIAGRGGGLMCLMTRLNRHMAGSAPGLPPSRAETAAN